MECIVVDDGSTDDPERVARRHRVTFLRSEVRRGPAHVRNLGARAARGHVLLFLDADVCPAVDTVSRVRTAFEADAGLDALIGSYDDAPASPGFVSQYKNLLHCFVHQNARREASTFWSGCGAVRRDVFLAMGGFDEAYDRPACEDIELGYRLVGDGRRVELDRELEVKHLKHWTLSSMIRCDIFDRGVPWTELIWRDRSMPDDLNLRVGQRVCVVLVGLLVAASVLVGALLLGGLASPSREAALVGLLGVWLLGVATVVALNHRFFRFLAERRGAAFAAGAVPLQMAFFFYSGLAFAIGTARWVAGLVKARSEIRPLEPIEEAVSAETA
jgi:cellulose synthase/poly-beta-1,6-N-acetylglucosamine synthase-like glycosyltransferase